VHAERPVADDSLVSVRERHERVTKAAQTARHTERGVRTPLAHFAGAA